MITNSNPQTGLGNKGNSRAEIKERMAKQAQQQMECERIAEVEAIRDLAFLGKEIWAGYSPEQKHKLETALINFARRGASRAWSYITSGQY